MKKPTIAELFYSRVLKLGNLLNEDSMIIFEYRVVCVCLLTIVVMVVGWLIDVVHIKQLALMLSGVCLGLCFTAVSLKIMIRVSRKSRKHPPSLKRISNFADFWGLGLRKRIKACAGEFDVEVKRLHKEKRFRMAKWNVVLAWGYAIWYVLRGPYDLVKGALVKALKGQ